MRSFTLLLCLALAGCAGANAAHDVVPSSQPLASAAPAPEPAGPKGRASRSAKLKQDDAPKEEWWKEGGVTREKINAMCWMKYEKGRADVPIDKRADLVNQCVAEALKEHSIR
jgi:hypothetical protein